MKFYRVLKGAMRALCLGLGILKQCGGYHGVPTFGGTDLASVPARSAWFFVSEPWIAAEFEGKRLRHPHESC